MIVVFLINTCFFRESFLKRFSLQPKESRVRLHAWCVSVTAASMLHWFLLWVQHIYTKAYLLKGKYPQVQILQSPFPAGVTVERLRGLHISMTPAGVANGVIFDFFLLSFLFITYLQIFRHRLSGI